MQSGAESIAVASRKNHAAGEHETHTGSNSHHRQTSFQPTLLFRSSVGFAEHDADDHLWKFVAPEPPAQRFKRISNPHLVCLVENRPHQTFSLQRSPYMHKLRRPVAGVTIAAATMQKRAFHFGAVRAVVRRLLSFK
jgi:hypothetical protein